MRILNLAAALLLAALAAFASPASAQNPAQAQRLKVGFALLGSANDQGWNHSHALGIDELKQKLGDRIEVSVAENVGAADAERVFRQFAQDGCSLVFGTTFEHMDPLLKVAGEFPAVAFEHCSGYKTAPNVGVYMGRMEQAEYLAGYMAGLMGFSRVGTVATNPIPEVVRGVNGFTRGLLKGLAESGATFDGAGANTVAWLNSWRDPRGETTVAETLVQRGAALVRQMADTPDSSLAACAKGVPAIGYGADPARFGGSCVLVSTLWEWGGIYVKKVQARLDGTWKAQDVYWGFAEGAVSLSPFHESVPGDVRAKVLAELERIRSGADDSFLGPLEDQAGKVMVPAGARATDKELFTMRWLLKGVKGKLPD
ncbi:Purine-binding protein [Fundidesulfovibrio magnetotacticus]|uniref:Purine-binding protein n=1 Tax=Fundidesulfovibrio magnetotacticus TaxID=2730080 RepID=A0A6V8LTC8_9BACT|nr:BMP family ABC transporter substrate-binding protein [Fundidesulfovibrio magnetotacticus]GFK93339.1 Purine-binding protein [Fundidesulfovibrio magnetotacticus]